jgi:hypothetical protein
MTQGIFRIRYKVFYVCALALCMSWVAIGIAQSTREARFAIEIPSQEGSLPTYALVNEDPGVISTTFLYDLHKLANPAADTRPASALALQSKVAGDEVFITATAIFGEVDPSAMDAALKNVPQQLLATHSGKLNDSVTFPELESIGLEPLTLRIVTARSDAPYHPLLPSQAPSMQIDYAPLNRISGMVTVHNLSGKAVDAFRLGNSVETGSGPGQADTTSQDSSKRGLSALIAPGSSFQVQMGRPQSGKTVNGKFIEDPTPSIVLEAVLFADGSYEGNARFAAEMAARQFGSTLQHRRIESLAEPILAEDDLNHGAKIERIRAAIKQLSVDLDPTTISEFRSQYSVLPNDALAGAEGDISSAMKSEKYLADHMIQQNNTELLSDQPRIALLEWWEAHYH